MNCEGLSPVAARVEHDLTEAWVHYLRYNLQNVDLANVQDIAAVQRQKLQDLRLGDLGYALFRDDRTWIYGWLIVRPMCGDGIVELQLLNFFQ